MLGSNKKNQKTFAPLVKTPGDKGAKVFCGAFFQKSDLFFLTSS
jgi:hypothetical protein